MNKLQFTSVARGLAGLALIFSALSLVGCAGQPLSNGVTGSAPHHEYLIGPGDSLNISVWRNPEASMSVPVRPDGKITIPLVEDMPAAGKSSSQLARDIEKTLSKYILDPIVTIIVTGFVGPYSEQIRIIGQAAKPQALPYRDNMTMLDVVIAVGGITEFAAGNDTRVIRNLEDGTQQQFIVRLDDLIKDGDISANIPMRPGDIIVVPESFF
ncbi:MAG: sugar ABC transporter substrate-binding protein [Gallionellales bacterium CG_4_10_14_3_um_filter_54_96]|nr:MAG: sugar ABC transporter substrate-binding protein [Gallionellales bacterium CG17_big_fil_post_rev_8_21_14_2_50_54_146]PIX03803.1 MAG: sugar ABC transporter substrate-binding protein [Gallionellales bacterium CG_4_8_14_3_um_filter_54_18]PIY03439.1 MAG: sugar ABC transporter substrate-binding protein [Gallionellales bacterium CG_4_10_14_3_um_filter_54_96]